MWTYIDPVTGRKYQYPEGAAPAGFNPAGQAPAKGQTPVPVEEETVEEQERPKRPTKKAGGKASAKARKPENKAATVEADK